MIAPASGGCWRGHLSGRGRGSGGGPTSVLPQPVGPIMRMFLGVTSMDRSRGSWWRRQRLPGGDGETRQTDRQTDRQTRQTYRQTRQADRQTDRHDTNHDQHHMESDAPPGTHNDRMAIRTKCACVVRRQVHASVRAYAGPLRQRVWRCLVR